MTHKYSFSITSISKALIFVAIFSTAANTLFRALSSPLATLFGYMAIIASLLYPVALFFCRRTIKVQYMLLLVVFSIAVLLSVAFSTDQAIGKSGMVLIQPLATFFAFYWALSFEKEKESPFNIRTIFLVNYILCAIYTVIAFSPSDFKYGMANEWGEPIFTLGLGNPNSVAIYVFFSFVVLCIQLHHVKNFISKLFTYGLIAVMFYLMILLQSRTILFCALLVFLYAVFFYRIKIRGWMVLAAMIIPFIMIAVQIVLVDYGTEIEILNKPLVSGRDKMYVSLLELFRSSHTTFAFGRYCEFKLDNLHNSPLTLLASFGFVGLIIYFIFWLFYLNDVRKQSFDPISRTACIALLCCMIHSSSETAFTVGYVPFCVFVLVLSMIAKGDIAIKNSPKEDNTLWQL